MQKQSKSSTAILLRRLLFGVQSYDIYAAIVMIVFSALALIFYPFVAKSSSIVLQNIVIALSVVSFISVVLINRTTHVCLTSQILHYPCDLFDV